MLGAVVHGWRLLRFRSLRVRFAMHPLFTSKYKFFAFVQTGIRTLPQNHLYQGHSGCTAILVACVACVCPPTPHGRVLKCWSFEGRGGNRGGNNKKGEHSLYKNKRNAQGDFNSLLEGYITYLLSHCATVPVPHDAAHF